MNVNPKITVIIPTYNRAFFVSQAIESVLAQRCVDYELIVSDNASTDDTLSVLARFEDNPRIKIFSNSTNVGMVANWRICVEQRSSGGWFLILSDDDLLIDPYFLAKVQKMVMLNPDLGLVYANGYLLDEETDRIDRLFLPYKGVFSGDCIVSSYGTVLAQNFTLCNIVFNKDRALDLGCFLDLNNICCDEELFLKLAVSYPVGCIQDCVSLYRVHSSNLSKKIAVDPEFHFYRVSNILKVWDIVKKSKPRHIYTSFKRNTRLLKILKDLLGHLEKSKREDLLAYLHLSYPEFVTQAHQFKDSKVGYLWSRLRMRLLKYWNSPIQAFSFFLLRSFFEKKVRRFLSPTFAWCLLSYVWT
jgi:glycosyltransferase involved in cell wall biosynthesis